MSRRWNLIPAVAALALLLVPALAGAQTPFAMRGTGQRLLEGDARMAGRGGWGMTVVDSLHPGFKNLASLATVRHVAVSFTAYGETSNNESPGDTRQTHRVITPDLRAAIPVAKSRLVLTAGFKLGRSSEWGTRIDSTWTVTWPDRIDTLSGLVQTTRSGTEFKVPLGAAWQATPWLAVAGAWNLESGSLTESLAYTYRTPASVLGIPLYGTNLRLTEDQYSGSSYTASALLRPAGGLRLGVSWTSAHDVDVDRKVEHAGVADRAQSEYVISRPEEWTAGVSARLNKRWSVGGDVQLMNYSELTGRDDWADELRDELGWCFGLERARANMRRGGWGNLPVRVGYSWRRWAHQIGGSDVIEQSISAGTGFPFHRNQGQLDVGLSYSMIGDLADNGLESRVWRLTVSVTGLEAWW